MVDRILNRSHAAEDQAENVTAAVWAHVQQARNLKRPHTLELLKAMADEFIELHGDRFFGDDSAIVGGLARIAGRRLVVIGFQKGQDTEENIRRNFGLPHPEGYRKAMRMMDLAGRYAMPVLTFVDVQGAFPGAAAGGDVVLALENSIYAVISPEGCATILWRSAEQSQLAAVAMKVTAGEQHELGIVDAVIPEPGEGAHTDPAEMARLIREAVMEQFDALGRIPLDELVEARFQRYRAYGPFAVADRSVVPPERIGIADRLRGLLAGRPTRPAFPGTKRGGSPDREEE